MTKTCTKCQETKPVDEFYTHWNRAKTQKLHYSRCKICWRDGINKQRSENRHVDRALQYRVKFGITVDEYDKMFDDQGGKCAICGREGMVGNKRLAVDHDHATGRIRGLLCWRCNTSIGKLGDDAESLRKALDYLERFEARS